MTISYSFHLSSKRHAVTDTNKVAEVSRHNLRQYMSEHYDKSKIEILRGSDKSILDDVKRIYHEEFDAALARYNSGKRADRVISDYLDHVSRSRNDVACEIIIQIGDRDFWEGKTLEERKQMSYIFNQQLTNLEFLVPEFRIASAVVHYDESSPHMHVVGIPVAYGYKRGMEKQVAKTKIFTAERLSELQDKMRKNAAYDMQLPQNRNLFSGTELKEKEKGRNKDIPKQSLTEYYALRQDITAANETLKRTQIQKSIQDAAIRKARQDASELYHRSIERQVEIKRLDKNIDEKLRRSSDIDQELSEKLRDSDQLDAVKKTKELEIQSLDDTITAKNNELADKERLSIYVEQRVKALQKQEQSLNFRIPLKQSELKKLKDEITSLSQNVEKSQQRANRLDEIIANRESVIRQRNRTLQEQDAQHKEFNQTISAQKKEIDSLYNQLDSVRSEISDSAHLAGESKKEVAKLDRQKKDRHEELDQLVTRITDLKVQEQSLSPKVARMRSELAESKGLAGEVEQKRQEVAELDRQVEDRQEELLSMADIDEHEMQSILNDAVTKNLVSHIIMIVCKLLSEWGIIRSDWRMLAVKLTKPVLADLGKSTDEFLQEVKEHRLKRIKSIAQKKRKTR